ncbi:hypothetical protein D3C77_546240 [compost metagenome]
MLLPSRVLNSRPLTEYAAVLRAMITGIPVRTDTRKAIVTCRLRCSSSLRANAADMIGSSDVLKAIANIGGIPAIIWARVPSMPSRLVASSRPTCWPSRGFRMEPSMK